MKSRVKTRQEIWSQQLEHRKVPKSRTKARIWKVNRSLLARQIRFKCSKETTRNLLKVKLGIKVTKLKESLIGWGITVSSLWPECYLTLISCDGDFILLHQIPVSTIKLPEWGFQASHEVSLLDHECLTGRSPGPQNKTFIREANPGYCISWEIKTP